MSCQERSTYLTISSTCPRRRPAGLWRVAHVLRVAVDRARQRRRLAQLEEWRLRDLGLSANDARREARKPFWRR